MNIFAEFSSRIVAAIETLGLQPKDGGALDFSRLAVEPPRDASHGDLATNAAMVLAKAVGENPRALAERIAAALRADRDVAAVDVAGPGFVNLRLSDDFWQARLGDMLDAADAYGRSDIGAGRKVNVEYVSANPTGPMHVGHCRGAVVGDALANIMGFAGYRVTKEYYINDAGAQIDVLARSVMLRYREALGERIGEIPAGLYPGDYLVPVGKALAEEFGIVAHLQLQALESADVLALLDSLEVSAATEFGPRLRLLTGGNPQFIVEVLKHMFVAGGPEAELSESSGLSERLVLLINERLAGLATPTLRLAQILAVLNEPIGPEALADVLRVSTPEVNEALADLEAVQICDGQEFVHDLMREAVIGLTSENTRKLLHRQIAVTLDRGGADLAHVAHHWIAAGTPVPGSAGTRPRGQTS